LQNEETRRENAELTETLALQRRRNQQLSDELQDLRLSRDDVVARNAELEKKQKRFARTQHSPRGRQLLAGLGSGSTRNWTG